MKKLYFLLVQMIVFCFGIAISSTSYSASTTSNDNHIVIEEPNKRVEGNQSSLWTPVSSFEDGSTYMIRSVSNPNLYWDLTGGYLTNGTEVQLYTLNYSHAQKFYFKKQFDYQGNATYRLAPLFAYEKVLRVTSNSENGKIVIASETYTDTHLFSDKMCFIPTYSGSSQFYISSALTGLGKKFTASTIQSGEKIIQKTGPSVLNDDYKWEIVKTDYIGLNVGNKTFINGTEETRYVARVPYVGEYVIETFKYGNAPSLDTYLRLNRDSDNTQVASNDDGGEDYNARIVYDFTTIEEYSIFVRGYSDYVSGYCYVVLRPLKTIYMSGTYDIDNRHVDDITCLNNTKQYCRNLGYFCEVYGNQNHGTVFSDTDWENTVKMDRDYYVFNGHGSGGTDAAYFDGSVVDWAGYEDIPSLQNAGLVVWMACESAHFSEVENGQRYTCLANECVRNGANYSLGFEGNIWSETTNYFVPKLFESLASNSLENSISIASQYAIQMNMVWYMFVNNQQDDIVNPVLISQNSVRGESINVALPDFDDIKNSYEVVDGFICKKTDSFLDLSGIKETNIDFISKLNEEWDTVVLFATENNNTISAYAVCVDNNNLVTRYYDILTQNQIQSYTFEEMMRINIFNSMF